MENCHLQLLRDRFATRSISTTPFPEEIVADLMEAIRLTPSCSNNQPWRYLFLQSPEALRIGHQALTGGNLKWVPRAPLLVVGYDRRSDDCLPKDGRAYYQFDLGMATMNLLLAATQHGLVARPMAGFDPQIIKQGFHMDEADEPLVLVAIGYPSEDEDHLPDYAKGMSKKPRQRKTVEEIIKRL